MLTTQLCLEQQEDGHCSSDACRLFHADSDVVEDALDVSCFYVAKKRGPRPVKTREQYCGIRLRRPPIADTVPAAAAHQWRPNSGGAAGY